MADKDISGWFGHYRAKVVEVDIEQNKYGAVRVFIPDLFTDSIKEGDSSFSESKNGLIAYPANNSMGGFNKDDSSADYQANIHVPLKGSWVWVRFEGGDPSRPFYENAFMYRNCEIPPENRGVSFPHKVVTLAKMQSGRAIVLCDSPDQERVEITGKKRQISQGPSGDSGSVYTIDGNMTTILLDERSGQEKLLTRSHKGDYINFDIENRKLQIYFKSDIIIKTDGNMSIEVKGALTIKAGSITVQAASGTTNISSSGDLNVKTDSKMSVKSGANMCFDSDAIVVIQGGESSEASPAIPLPPIGIRG